MAENVAEDFDLAQLAAQVGLSKFHFHRLFKSAVGVSPSRYHINLRMDEAKRLLRETKQSVVAIALDVGYSNPSHFAQLFRRETGLPARHDGQCASDGITLYWEGALSASGVAGNAHGRPDVSSESLDRHRCDPDHQCSRKHESNQLDDVLSHLAHSLSLFLSLDAECHLPSCGIRSADGFNDFWLASIVPLCNLFACVTEQVGGPLNAGHVAANFAAKIMLGEPFFDVRVFKQPRHETLPH